MRLTFAFLAWLACALATPAAFTSSATACGSPSTEESESVERVLLNDQWEFRRDESEEWKPVQLPCTFESHEGIGFDGVGWYRRPLKRVQLPEGIRSAIRFEGAATHATVWCDGHEVGTHLGGWTPFECDVSDYVQKGVDEDSDSDLVELLVRVDEMVGHNSQGFLPVFAPHFGGLWKDVSLVIRHAQHIDRDSLFVWGDTETNLMRLEVPVVDSLHGERRDSAEVDGIRVKYRRHTQTIDNKQEWREGALVVFTGVQEQELIAHGRTVVPIAFPIESPVLWSPEDPALYDLRIELLRDTESNTYAEGNLLSGFVSRAGFRSIDVDSERLLLNGHPIQVRGILNWGYAPPSTAPSLDPEFWAKELDLVKAYGFNLMKFCLWIPPREYLRMADERGILVWIEYPTWHSKWSADQLPTLENEFDEFFAYDRSHPSVILRSLTCETGPSADLNVIQSLYDRCHAKIPGSIVEDDSSWIEWNRVHDFYDDHPYGNNHTWVATLDRLKSHIANGESKPLILGEAIAADTWVVPEPLEETVGKDRPFWLPGFLDANREWSRDREQDMGKEAVARLESDSLDYAMRMRKYQIETYRREVPYGGYVVSVIRDFPLAGMGLIDFQGNPKWEPSAWDWHGDQSLILKTENDRRSFAEGEELSGQILLSRFSNEPIDNATLRLTLSRATKSSASSVRKIVRDTRLAIDRNHGVLELDAFRFPLNALWESDSKLPIEVVLQAEIVRSSGTVVKNSWAFWLVPKPEKSLVAVELHSSCSDATRSVFEDLGGSSLATEKNAVIVAQRFDEELLDRLQDGARVLMIPDGEQNSMPLQSQWFLRGGPIVQSTPKWNSLHRMLNQLQHFDLASRVVPNMQWLSDITPMLMLWDNHDIKEVRTHGLVFATRVGKGTLLVNALQLAGEGNAVGPYLASRLVASLADPESPTSLLSDLVIASMQDATIQSLRGKLQERTLSLTERPWRFRVDKSNEGLDQGWHLEGHALGDAWGSIRVGSHWESQGYASLDGWAWYAIDLELPDDWRSDNAYLWIDGGDDYYEVYVDGQFVGSAGDLNTRTTAFEERSTFPIPSSKTQRDHRIAIRVNDWQGAGGMFRPIQWSSIRRPAGPQILK